MTKKLPKQCRDRNQSYSWHNGKRIYHGIWKSSEADAAYRRFIAELLESPAGILRHHTGDVLIAELAADFLNFHTARLDESHVRHFRLAIAYLVEICGDIAVNDFSPKKLKIVRNQMVKKGTLCRKQINDYTGRLVRIFRWGVEEEQVKTTTWQALTAVKSLPPGEPGTFDNEIVRGVPREVVDRTLPFMPATVSAMVLLQRETAMRPGEICRMRVGDVAAGDIEQGQDSELWYYTLERHKTQKHIGKKVIPLGKIEQVLIAPYLEGKKAEQAVFSPRQAMKERGIQSDGIGDFYDKDSYRKAIVYAIKKGNKAGQVIPHWTPYQLRHAGATELAERVALGREVAREKLGHTKSSTTKRYTAGAELTVAEDMARNRRN